MCDVNDPHGLLAIRRLPRSPAYYNRITHERRSVDRPLQEYDLDYRSRFVEAMHSERDVVKRVSGKRTVPAIVDERTGVTMSESANIVEYLENTYGDGE